MELGVRAETEEEALVDCLQGFTETSHRVLVGLFKLDLQTCF